MTRKLTSFDTGVTVSTVTPSSVLADEASGSASAILDAVWSFASSLEDLTVTSIDTLAPVTVTVTAVSFTPAKSANCRVIFDCLASSKSVMSSGEVNEMMLS